LAIFLGAVVFLNEFSKLAANVLKGEMRVGETAILNVVQQITYTGIGGILVFSGEGAFGLVAAFAAGLLTVILLGVAKWETSVSRPSIESATSLFNYSKYSVVAYVDSYLYNWLDIAVIGFLLTQTHVGTYEIAWRVTALVMIFSSVIETTILPQISSWDAQGQKEEIASVLPNAILASLFFVIPAFFGSLVVSSELLHFIFGEEYASAWLVLIILMSGKIIEAIDRILKNVLSGMDRPDLRASAVLVSIVLNLILNFSLVMLLGAVGAAIATTVSFGASTIIIWYFLKNIITITLPYRAIGGCIAASAGMASGLYLLKSAFGISSIFSLIAFITLGVVLFAIFVNVFPTVREKERMALDAID
jgi:O-antigen/teichoic acid export membrane protein